MAVSRHVGRQISVVLAEKKFDVTPVELFSWFVLATA